MISKSYALTKFPVKVLNMSNAKSPPIFKPKFFLLSASPASKSTAFPVADDVLAAFPAALADEEPLFSESENTESAFTEDLRDFDILLLNAAQQPEFWIAFEICFWAVLLNAAISTFILLSVGTIKEPPPDDTSLTEAVLLLPPAPL